MQTEDAMGGLERKKGRGRHRGRGRNEKQEVQQGQARRTKRKHRIDAPPPHREVWKSWLPMHCKPLIKHKLMGR